MTDAQGILLCPYTASTCPLLAPFGALGSPSSGVDSPAPPTPSACASAHQSSLPSSHLNPNYGSQEQQDGFFHMTHPGVKMENGGRDPLVPIHPLSQRQSVSPTLSISEQLNSFDRQFAASASAPQVYNSAPRSAAGSRPTSPPPPSLMYDPPEVNETHLQQPVFSHAGQQTNTSSYTFTPPGTMFTRAEFAAEGDYGSFGAQDMEDIGFGQNQHAESRSHLEKADATQAFSQTAASSPEEGSGEQTAFISKLWHLLTHDEYSRYLTWNRQGDAFVLSRQNEFAQKVLPRFFRHSNVASFVRQLNLYSFQRVSTIKLLDMADSSTSTSILHASNPRVHHNSHMMHQNVDGSFSPDSDSESHSSAGGSPVPDDTVTASGFSHPNFQRDHPELLCKLKPRGSAARKPAGSKKLAHRVGEDDEKKQGSKRGSLRKR